MADDRISAEDRLDLLDLLGRYFFAVDSGDSEGVVACFAENGAVRYGTGEIYRGASGLQEFARKAIGGLEIRGRMHLNFPLYFSREGDLIVLRSYLSAAQWSPPQPPKAFGSTRFIEDRFVRTPAGWRIMERAIYLWNAETVEEVARTVREASARSI